MMTTEVTVVATTAITAAAAVGGAWIGLLAGRQQIKAEDSRQRWLRAQARRDERKEAYRAAIDLITDWHWDTMFPPPDYNVLEAFTKPFVHAASAVRVYGSDQSYAAIERFQDALNDLNDLNDMPDPSPEDAQTVWAEIEDAIAALFDAAREDVGPSAEDLPSAKTR